MKTWKLCLLALVPGALGWLSNVLLARVIFLPLPAALVNLLPPSTSPPWPRSFSACGWAVGAAGGRFRSPNICSAPSGPAW